MKLVIDTNILFSFFRKNPVREMIINSENYNVELFSPDYVLEELNRNIPDLIKYSGFTEEQIKFLINGLKYYIKTFSSDEYKTTEEEAKLICPDKKDVPLFAVSLKLNCSIWSNEPRLKKQEKVKVLTTRELRELLEIG